MSWDDDVEIDERIEFPPGKPGTTLYCYNWEALRKLKSDAFTEGAKALRESAWWAFQAEGNIHACTVLNRLELPTRTPDAPPPDAS